MPKFCANFTALQRAWLSRPLRGCPGGRLCRCRVMFPYAFRKDDLAEALERNGLAPLGVGGLRQAALRGAGGGARLSVPLHPPGRDREQPAPRLRRPRRDVPLEGLPRPRRRDGRRVDQDHDLLGGRVHPPLPAAVLPDGFHRIRHYGLFASGTRAVNIARIRNLLAPVPSDRPTPSPPTTSHQRLPAPAAAVASSSSSASALGRTRGRVRPPLSGLTRHDPRPEHDRASPIERAAISTRIAQAPLALSHLIGALHPCRTGPAVVLSPPRSAPDSISAHQRSRRDPPHTLTTRASGLLNPHRSRQRRRRPLVPRFPPWRLSNAGHRRVRTVAHGPASETLHNSGTRTKRGCGAARQLRARNLLSFTAA